MIKNRKHTFPTLIDLHYKHSMNNFQEFYGENISYSEIEQVSYIDFKDMMFEMVGKGVKFRKFGRDKNILTIRADMHQKEYELFLRIFREEEVDEEKTNDIDDNPEGETKFKSFNFFHEFTISSIRELTNAERLRFKKNLEDFDDDEVDDEDIDVDE